MKRALFLLTMATTVSGQPAGLTLGIDQAMRLAVQNNLTRRLAVAASEEARGQAIQAAQPISAAPNAPMALYWMWRFDHRDDPILLKNLWGKNDLQAVADIQAANDPTIEYPNGPSDVMIVEDPYFPATTPTAAPSIM